MRLRPPGTIVDEIAFFNKEYNVDLFHFTDSVVNRPVGHFEAVCEEIIARDLKISWTGFFREDTFTQKLADLALKSGLTACYFSADGLTKHGLRVLKKQLTIEDVLRASRITVENNILTMHHFLVNLPLEFPDNVREAKEMMRRILDIHESSGNLGAVIFNNVRLYPDAPLTKKLKKEKQLGAEIDLLYPVYYNPLETAHIRYEIEAMCHAAGVFSRLEFKKTTFKGR